MQYATDYGSRAAKIELVRDMAGMVCEIQADLMAVTPAGGSVVSYRGVRPNGRNHHHQYNHEMKARKHFSWVDMGHGMEFPKPTLPFPECCIPVLVGTIVEKGSAGDFPMIVAMKVDKARLGLLCNRITSGPLSTAVAEAECLRMTFEIGGSEHSVIPGFPSAEQHDVATRQPFGLIHACILHMYALYKQRVEDMSPEVRKRAENMDVKGERVTRCLVEGAAWPQRIFINPFNFNTVPMSRWPLHIEQFLKRSPYAQWVQHIGICLLYTSDAADE